MSIETNETPKKSILTRAMEAVAAKENGEGTDENATSKKITRKQIIIGAGAVVGTAAAIFAAISIFTGNGGEEMDVVEETEESPEETA